MQEVNAQEIDELEDADTAFALDRETFERLADEWERDRPRGVDIEQMTKHPAYQSIIAMGDPAVPWLLQRLSEKPDHWFVALNAITGARPVPPESGGLHQGNGPSLGWTGGVNKDTSSATSNVD